MSLPVSLKQFTDELAMTSEESAVYLNRRTGEFLFASQEHRYVAEADEEEDEDPPEWQRESVSKIREAHVSDDWLTLPSKFDIDEYDIMRRYCATLSDRVLAADLLDTIGGRGTFGRFKNMLHRHKVHEPWYRFRDAALTEIAREWLEANEIPFKD